VSYRPESSDVPLEETSDGPDRRLITRLVVAAVVVILAILFVVQNSDRVQTTFVFFDVTTRLWVGLVVALLLGALLGQAVEALWARRKKRKAAS
jgi:lipopolysaccharide assembly protein A